MENLILAALLLPRSTTPAGAAPVVLGKALEPNQAPEGFASLLEGLSQSAGAETSIGLPLLQKGATSQEKDVSSDPPQSEEAGEAAKPAQDPEQTQAVQPQVIPVAIPALPLEPLVAATDSAQQTAPDQEMPERPASPAGGLVQLAASVMEPAARTAGAPRQMPAIDAQASSVPATTSARPQSNPETAPSPASPRGVNLALLEEAGMNILRATGEAELPPSTGRTTQPTASIPLKDGRTQEGQLLEQVRSSTSGGDPSQEAVSRTLTPNDSRSIAPGVEAAKRESPSRHAQGAQRPDPQMSAARSAQAAPQAAREVLGGQILLDDAKQTPAANQPEQKQVTDSNSDVRPERPRTTGESAQAPADETAPSQKAHDGSTAGKEEVKLNAEPPGGSRTGVHEASQKLSPLRAETRAPELARALVDQVVRAFQLEVKGPVSEMRLKLEPETLGELALRVRVEEGKMQARIEVSQPAVKAIIEGNLPQLRQALASQGIQMDRIDIATQDRSLSRGHSDGSGARDRRQTPKDAEAPIQDAPLQSVRMLGYNTIELTM